MQTTLDRARATPGANLTFHDFAPEQESFLGALIAGLSAERKSVPCRFLYDAQGSALFEAICRQPEYYPTRTELEILRRYADDIASRIGADAELIELGSGASEKVGVLLDALFQPTAYVPVDISREALREAARRVATERPELEVHAVCADYGAEFDLPRLPGAGRRVAFYPGSTIGNFTPPEATGFLRHWAERLETGALLLIGVDLQKSPAVLNAAYDDAAGVTAQFSLNVLARANRELGADFDLSTWRHEARYLPAEGRVAIHLRALRSQTIHVAGRSFDIAAGEALHVEDSWKYTVDGFQDLALKAGYAPRAVWTDPRHMFSVHLLEVRG